MSQTLLEMAKELVTEQIRMQGVSPEEAQSLLLSTHATLRSLYEVEMSGLSTSPKPQEKSTQADWRRSINKHAVECLECGRTFRQLSARHLRKHDLDPRTYRQKHGIPQTQALSSREVTARRRAVAQQVRPWERAALLRTTTNADVKKRGSATKTGQTASGREAGN